MILTAPAIALADKACSFQGSWYGYLPTLQLDFLLTVHGYSGPKGTVSLEIPGLNLALFGFPNVVNIPTFRGTWERIDNQSVALTVVGYAINSSGQTEVIGKISSIDTFAEGCNSINIQNTNEFYAPDQDPFGDDDPEFGSFPAAPHSASRMRVDPPVY
jgi:hypothetical protein